MNTTRNQAICMFYYVKFTPENVEIYKRKLEESELEICYNTTPNQPVLVAKQRILGDPLTYRKYLDVVPDKKVNQKRKKCELQTDAQVVQFINNIYCVDDPNNHEAYQKKLVTTKEIFDTINEYTTIFENKTVLAFARWCSKNKTLFLRAKEDRNASNRRRELYVMNDIYYDCMLISISEYLPNYQQSLKTLQNNEFEIIGYARKSPTTDSLDKRVKLLESMINNLRSRSFATRIYVSACSRASTPFSERDLKDDDEIYKKLNNIDGNTQEMMKYLHSANHNVCLVSIDFPGLSSRSHQVKELLEKNPSIQKVAIETFAISNEVFIYDSETLLSDTKLLEKFECRPRPIQRSK